MEKEKKSEAEMLADLEDGLSPTTGSLRHFVRRKVHVLFLDDDKYRHRKVWDDECDSPAAGEACVHHVWTADEAIEAMLAREFDLVMLDHDLAVEDQMRSPDDVDAKAANGTHVVRWMSANWPHEKKPDVVVHTYNGYAAKGMVGILKNGGFDATYRPFCPGLLEFGLKLAAFSRGLREEASDPMVAELAEVWSAVDGGGLERCGECSACKQGDECFEI